MRPSKELPTAKERKELSRKHLRFHFSVAKMSCLQFSTRTIISQSFTKALLTLIQQESTSFLPQNQPRLSMKSIQTPIFKPMEIVSRRRLIFDLMDTIMMRLSHLERRESQSRNTGNFKIAHGKKKSPKKMMQFRLTSLCEQRKETRRETAKTL